MNWKLNEDFTNRIPLALMERDGVLYLQSQIEVAREDGLCYEIYCIFDSVAISLIEEVGKLVMEALRRFEDYSDLTIEQFHDITHMSQEEYKKRENETRFKVTKARNDEDLRVSYICSSIKYNINTQKYSFVLEWVDLHRKGHYTEFSPSNGDKKIATFDTLLEFYLEDMTPEKMGKMVLEALERSEKMGNIVNRKRMARKEITLLDESILSIPIPLGRHFADEEDGRVGEIYQLYSYYPDDYAQEPVALYYLGIAAELSCDLKLENIRSVWEELYGKSEQFEMTEEGKGIFSLRVEMRNKKHHRISYLLEMEEDLLLECTMDVMQPNRRKKADAKLTTQFEKFAKGCRFVKKR